MPPVRMDCDNACMLRHAIKLHPENKKPRNELALKLIVDRLCCCMLPAYKAIPILKGILSMKKLFLFGLILLSTILIFTGCVNSGDFKDPDLEAPSISVTSSSIVDGKLLTATAAARKPNDPIGLNQSPALSWEAVEGAS